jgi:hypothetical protein
VRGARGLGSGVSTIEKDASETDANTANVDQMSRTAASKNVQRSAADIRRRHIPQAAHADPVDPVDYRLVIRRPQLVAPTRCQSRPSKAWTAIDWTAAGRTAAGRALCGGLRFVALIGAVFSGHNGGTIRSVFENAKCEKCQKG